MTKKDELTAAITALNLVDRADKGTHGDALAIEIAAMKVCAIASELGNERMEAQNFKALLPETT